jgi:succinylarginine dihydrolase
MHHGPLQVARYLADEGADNQTRFCEAYGAKGIKIFFYGRSDDSQHLSRFPARQTLEASSAIARLHSLDPQSNVFALQSPEAIDAGAFHNDVVAVGNENVLLYHERAYADGVAMVGELRQKFESEWLIPVPEQRVSLKDAVNTYLFNSQLVTLPDGTMSLIAPIECQENLIVSKFIDELLAAPNPIASVHYLDVRQSMKNGGGPACLRLRVVLTEDELARVHGGVVLTEKLYQGLVNWVRKHYRNQINPEDLADPRLAEESRAALDELTTILQIGPIYPFQK